MYVKKARILCVLLACFFYCWSFGVELVVYTSGKQAEHIGSLIVNSNEEQVVITFSPCQVQAGPSSSVMQLCPFHNHIDSGTMPSIRSFVLFKPEDLIVKSYMNHYMWANQTASLCVQMTDISGQHWSSGVTHSCLINQNAPFQTQGIRTVNFWAMVAELIDSQLDSADKFINKAMTDSVVLHNANPQNREHFIISTIQLINASEFLIKFQPNAQKNLYEIRVIINDGISSYNNVLDRVLYVLVVRNSVVKTILGCGQCPVDIFNSDGSRRPPPPPPPGGAALIDQNQFMMRGAMMQN